MDRPREGPSRTLRHPSGRWNKHLVFRALTQPAVYRSHISKRDPPLRIPLLLGPRAQVRAGVDHELLNGESHSPEMVRLPDPLLAAARLIGLGVARRAPTRCTSSRDSWQGSSLLLDIALASSGLCPEPPSAETLDSVVARDTGRADVAGKRRDSTQSLPAALLGGRP
jgi:hypothetical protein